MRISDWSSDVCSSDLALKAEDHLFEVADGEQGARPIAVCAFAREEFLGKPRDDRPLREVGVLRLIDQDMLGRLVELVAQDRKSVVKGKSVSVRVDLGGRRIIKKKTI